MDVCQASPPLSEYTYLTYVTKKYGCHFTNMTNTAMMLNEHLDSTCFHLYANTQPTAVNSSPSIHICISSKCAPQMSHI